MMYRIVVLALFLAAVMAGDDMKKCGRLFKPDLEKCCKEYSEKIGMINDDTTVKECMDLPMKPTSCEREICIATKRDFIKGTDNFDKVAFQNHIEKDFDDSDFVKTVIDNCINGDLDMYGPPPMCPLKKLVHCVRLQGLIKCPEWNSADECSGMKELVEECSQKN